jgi:uncharacterized membrane protein
MDSDRIVKVGIVIIVTAALIILSFIAAPYIMGIFKPIDDQATVGYTSETVRAEVLNIQEEGLMTVGKQEQTYQIVEIEVMEGAFKNSHMFLEFGKNQVMPEEYILKPGNEILVTVGISPLDNTPGAFFVDFVRGKALVWIFLLFAIISFIIGSWTGLRSLLGIVVGMGVIILFIIPQIANGVNPVATSIIGSVVFLAVSLYLVYGWRAMTHSAVISMTLSLILTGGISIFAVKLARLTGFGNENMMFLIQQSENQIDMRGILLAGIIIGSLGVLDDLVVGQSSAVFQLSKANADLKFQDLYQRAMTIGRDHAAASVNTLVLAYAGESLPMLLLFHITNVNLGMAVNVSFIAEEIVRALAGTIGLFLSIPISTAIACLWVLQKPEIAETEKT